MGAFRLPVALVIAGTGAFAVCGCATDPLPSQTPQPSATRIEKAAGEATASFQADGTRLHVTVVRNTWCRKISFGGGGSMVVGTWEHCGTSPFADAALSLQLDGGSHHTAKTDTSGQATFELQGASPDPKGSTTFRLLADGKAIGAWKATGRIAEALSEGRARAQAEAREQGRRDALRAIADIATIDADLRRIEPPWTEAKVLQLMEIGARMKQLAIPKDIDALVSDDERAATLRHFASIKTRTELLVASLKRYEERNQQQALLALLGGLQGLGSSGAGYSGAAAPAPRDDTESKRKAEREKDESRKREEDRQAEAKKAQREAASRCYSDCVAAYNLKNSRCDEDERTCNKRCPDGQPGFSCRGACQDDRNTCKSRAYRDEETCKRGCG